jgi:hypothetical protein
MDVDEIRQLYIQRQFNEQRNSAEYYRQAAQQAEVEAERAAARGDEQMAFAHVEDAESCHQAAQEHEAQANQIATAAAPDPNEFTAHEERYLAVRPQLMGNPAAAQIAVDASNYFQSRGYSRHDPQHVGLVNDALELCGVDTTAVPTRQDVFEMAREHNPGLTAEEFQKHEQTRDIRKMRGDYPEF